MRMRRESAIQCHVKLHVPLIKLVKESNLEQKGKLRVEVADNYTAPAENDVKLIRAKEHRLSLTCVCISKDSEFAFTGCKSGSVIKWSLREKKKLGSLTYKTHSKYITGGVTSIAITTDSKYLATSDSSPDIQIWDPHTMKHVYTFKGHIKMLLYATTSFRPEHSNVAWRQKWEW
ncbi:jg14117 [Pararge aegeria aegeria]|uniref:Jg14117 protein n=1 Tax=Pararge aegeria aegeria TaxID=348720 RepID=A0A8S4RX63_9NEOP|nr:jg14117 [Pararge aegeria aegeria]